MSEQAGPAEGGTTPPAVAGPEGTPGTAEQETTQQEIDWQNRYQHLQPEYTRSQQENAQLREQIEHAHALLSSEDPDTRRAAAEALGYEFQEEQPDPDPNEDPLSHLDERLGRIEQSLSAREQEAQDDAYAEQVRGIVDERLSTLGIPEADQDWVLAYAINALPITRGGSARSSSRRYRGLRRARDRARQREWAKGKARAAHRTSRASPLPRSPTSTTARNGWTTWSAAWQENEQGSLTRSRRGPQPSVKNARNDHATNRSEHGYKS
jgi:hypothetical protein